MHLPHADHAARAAVEGQSFAEASATVDLMADVMRERVAQDGACTVDHLSAAGFTAAEIAEYADIARGRAARAMVRSAQPARRAGRLADAVLA